MTAVAFSDIVGLALALGIVTLLTSLLIPFHILVNVVMRCGRISTAISCADFR